MRVVNAAADSVVADVERKASVLGKAVGLRFRRDGRALFPLRRPRRPGIDMLFVPRPLDVVFVDADREIAEIHGAFPVGLHPDTWRIYRPREPCRYVLEVEQGLTRRLGFAPGQELRFEDE